MERTQEHPWSEGWLEELATTANAHAFRTENTDERIEADRIAELASCLADTAGNPTGDVFAGGFEPTPQGVAKALRDTAEGIEEQTRDLEAALERALLFESGAFLAFAPDLEEEIALVEQALWWLKGEETRARLGAMGHVAIGLLEDVHSADSMPETVRALARARSHPLTQVLLQRPWSP